MSAFEAAVRPLRKYADFSGRSSRSEFWLFMLLVMLVQALARVIDGFFGNWFLPGPFSMLAAVALIVPQIAVTVRRLHDVGRSGRELIAPALMLVGLPLIYMFRGLIGGMIALGYLGVVLLLFAHIFLLLIRKGGSIPNRYGKSPSAFSFAG